MSAVEAERLAAIQTAIVHRSPAGRISRRVAIGYLVAVIAAPPITLAVLALAGPSAPEPVAPVSRVVSSWCSNGWITQGIDSGRPDGLLLARNTGVAC